MCNIPISVSLKLCTVYDIFSVKEWRDLETGRRGRSWSLKMAPFDRSCTVRLSIGMVGIVEISVPLDTL